MTAEQEPGTDQVAIDLWKTTDAMEWAQAFTVLYPEPGVDTMLGWFANAIEKGRAAGLAEGDGLTPEEDAQLDVTARAYLQHRTDVVRSAVEFIDRVQQYARETMRRDGQPGPMEMRANSVGAILRAEFAKDLVAFPAPAEETK